MIAKCRPSGQTLKWHFTQLQGQCWQTLSKWPAKTSIVDCDCCSPSFSGVTTSSKVQKREKRKWGWVRRNCSSSKQSVQGFSNPEIEKRWQDGGFAFSDLFSISSHLTKWLFIAKCFPCGWWRYLSWKTVSLSLSLSLSLSHSLSLSLSPPPPSLSLSLSIYLYIYIYLSLSLPPVMSSKPPAFKQTTTHVVLPKQSLKNEKEWNKCLCMRVVG